MLVEHLSGELKGDDAVAEVADHPRLLEIIDDRQRTLPHIVVDADRTGATVTGFDAGEPTDSTEVDGDTEHIHRVRGGGWSHRRYQQRREHVERNAGEVADVVTRMARDLDPVLIALVGEVRAIQFLHEALDHEFGDRLVDIDAGDLDGVSSAVVDQLADRRAGFQVGILERLRDEGITDPTEVERALRDGRVETLLVAGPTTSMHDDARRERLDAVGAAITAALTTSANVVVVPQTAEMDGGVAALARW
ncbi:MAG: Vms1/Ankzf1 family peptidyl-tRNA hydrolase [Ilumatobacteraceae bacterium]